MKKGDYKILFVFGRLSKVENSLSWRDFCTLTSNISMHDDEEKARTFPRAAHVNVDNVICMHSVVSLSILSTRSFILQLRMKVASSLHCTYNHSRVVHFKQEIYLKYHIIISEERTAPSTLNLIILIRSKIFSFNYSSLK